MKKMKESKEQSDTITRLDMSDLIRIRMKYFEEKLDHLNEGDSVPREIIANCKKNEYGGYVLQYKNLLYFLNDQFQLETKIPQGVKSKKGDTWSEEDSRIHNETTIISNCLDSSDWMLTQMRKKTFEFKKGDRIPDYLESYCEHEINQQGGARIFVGDHLYLLDNNRVVQAKMGLNYQDH